MLTSPRGPLPPAHSCVFLQAEHGIRYLTVTGVQTCALPIWRMRLLGPLAVLAAAAPLILSVFGPGLPVTALLWAVSGAGSGYQLAANVAFVSAVPNSQIGRASCRERV